MPVVPYPTLCSLQHTAPPTSVVYPVTLKFEEVVYKVKVGERGWLCGVVGSSSKSAEKSILNGVSGQVCPGEMLAMLGPSGSGKTTLLTALGGRLPSAGPRKLSGKITYNGQAFASSVRRKIGFVSQDDVLYPNLTVSETLTFTALLRLPRTLARAEKVEKVRRVIAELGLEKVAHSMIGGPLFRGVSGGERKRVSIGQEMLVNPSLLLLDEPTSGLDSTTAQRIVTMLKRLAAEGGRTVVTTIHQPSSRLYHMFDKVVVLSQGFPIYYGSASAALEYFSSIGFSSAFSSNPADLMLDLANGIPPDSNQATSEQGDTTDEEQKLVSKKLISAYEQIFATKLKGELKSMDSNIYGDNNKRYQASMRAKGEKWSTSWWEQFRVLLMRSLKERRFEAFNKLRIFQVISVATLGGLLWWHSSPNRIQDRTSLLFFFSVFWGFFPLYNAVFTFPQERSMLIKERSSGMYRLSSYFLARTAGDLPMELALPTAFVIIIYCYKLLLGVQFRDGDTYECSPGVMCRVVDFPAIKSVGLNHMWIDVCVGNSSISSNINLQ